MKLPKLTADESANTLHILARYEGRQLNVTLTDGGKETLIQWFRQGETVDVGSMDHTTVEPMKVLSKQLSWLFMGKEPLL